MFNAFRFLKPHKYIKSSYNYPYINKQLYSTLKQIKKFREDIRNVAIVAHVDHGKTTLVDKLLKKSGELDINNDEDRVMDSNNIEKERGITILSKCTSLNYNNIRINVVDTPGHQDFGGEVERILSMIDGIVLLIDVNEGPMPQTRYILEKAFKKGMTPLLILNKIDRMADPERLDDCLMEIMECFDNVGYNNDEIDKILHNILYCSAKNGVIWKETDIKNSQTYDMGILLEKIIDTIKPPEISQFNEYNDKFRMLANLIDSDEFWGRYLIGKVISGNIKIGDTIHAINGETKDETEIIKIERLFSKKGMKRIEIKEVSAGDIIGIPCENANVFDTLCDLSITEPLPIDNLDKPTLCIRILQNDSPLRGKDPDTKYVLMSDIEKRLIKESKINVCITINKISDSQFEIYGRGELQLAVLLENLRREGYELQVAAPKVILKKNEDGKGGNLEPYEMVGVECPKEYMSDIMEFFDSNYGELVSYDTDYSKDFSKIQYIVATRCLLGYEMKFKTDTKGSGKLSKSFHEYRPYNTLYIKPNILKLVATSAGQSTFYGINRLEERSRIMYISPGDDIYEGMVIGETNATVEIEGNACQAKKLTNLRSTSKEEMIQLKEPKTLFLEEMLTKIQDDELLEITPNKVRLRKTVLSNKERVKGRKSGKDMSI